MHRLLCLVVFVAACAAPPPTPGDDEPGRSGPVPTDPSVHTIQLYQTGEEISLPVISLRSRNTLSLEFDILGDAGAQPLDVTFRRLTTDGGADLVPSEYLRGFDRDQIFDADPSGNTAVRYVHYEYAFPNTSVGFLMGGVYALTVSDPDGRPLFERTFYVSEDRVDADILFGTRLAETGAVGVAVQPAARLTPRGDLAGEDAYRFTVCFVRDGDVSDLRCAPEPTLAELAVYGFYLPRDRAFQPLPPTFRLDLGILGVSQDVLEADIAANPPTALLEPDYAAFGGEVLDPSLLTASRIDTGFRDAGDGDDDAEYVDVTFRYVPQDERELPGSVYVRGGFNDLRRSPGNRLTWVPEFRRYEGTFLVKQGIYTYDYIAPRAPASRQAVALGQPSVYTALVFYRDLTRFANRLVGVQSAVAR